jgi:hypothetical protein
MNYRSRPKRRKYCDFPFVTYTKFIDRLWPHEMGCMVSHGLSACKITENDYEYPKTV